MKNKQNSFSFYNGDNNVVISDAVGNFDMSDNPDMLDNPDALRNYEAALHSLAEIHQPNICMGISCLTKSGLTVLPASLPERKPCPSYMTHFLK